MENTEPLVGIAIGSTSDADIMEGCTSEIGRASCRERV